MFIEYYDAIESFNLSNEDKKTLIDFLELLDKYRNDPEKFSNYTSEELNRIFQIANISPKLQIEMWEMLPDEIVKNAENIKIFENVLDNKFGAYISGIDKKALVKMLNDSRSPARSYG